MKIYRDFDQAELDKHYNIRATVVDATPAIERYKSDTLKVQAEIPCELGLKYGETTQEYLDYYEAKPNAPVFVFIHGGYWRMLNAVDGGFMAANMKLHGISTVSVNYALCPTVSVSEIVNQCRKAIYWIYHNLSKNIYVCGSSAGGHLAAIVMSADWLEAEGLPKDAIKGGVLLSGLYDLEPLPLTYTNSWLNLTKEEAIANSPVYHLPHQSVKLIYSVAPNETSEFIRQTHLMQELTRKNGNQTVFIDAPHTDHFTAPFELSDANSPMFKAFLKSVIF